MEDVLTSTGAEAARMRSFPKGPNPWSSEGMSFWFGAVKMIHEAPPICTKSEYRTAPTTDEEQR